MVALFASRAASSLRAACGRLVNAAVAAVGPELDAISRDGRQSHSSETVTETKSALPSFFAFASALMDPVSDGGREGARPPARTGT